jgi:DNA-directed RNA polymerase specialized sigma24 family protein
MESDFEAFYESVGPAVQRLALVLTGNVHDANDLTQTVFERLYSKWRRLEVRDPHAYARVVVVLLCA